MTKIGKMTYRENKRNGDRLSPLAYGFMRAGRDAEAARVVLRHAVASGINYIDTAYMYPGNEELLGKLLEEEGLRNRVKIATKLPPQSVKKSEDFERLFCTSLKRLRTDYIDYYLIHNLNGIKEWERLCSLGLREWLADLKSSGRAINVGFSFHGNSDLFIKLVDFHDWDFAMVQYNYLDEHTQAGRKGVDHAASKNIPLMIMTPLRGGVLADKMPDEAVAVFKKHNADRSPADWALRWLWNQPEILTVLSGMRTIDEVNANIAAAVGATCGRLTTDELAVYDEVRETMRRITRVPCTYCGYCRVCPKGVDIPTCFDAYNQRSVAKGFRRWHIWYFYIHRTINKNAGRCNGCRMCEKHCPQEIEIAKELESVKREMEGILFRFARFAARKIMRLDK
ncbi:MAG: aldo/keto reductase [Defluviitaleaceae bacterium]|nr:aldo/keto reductase [Defluviitaleaceae bacterium]